MWLFALGASLPALSSISFAQQKVATPDGKNDEVVSLGKIEVQGEGLEGTVLPVRPTGTVNGFDEQVKDIPRSVYQVTKAQLDRDVIETFADLSLYAPSVQRTSPSAYSTFAAIRGGNTDTMRNGTLLLNPEVHPFANNSWEAVDVVAGTPSVVYGSTTRTAGYVNYITKKPAFDRQHTELSAILGRASTESDGSLFQINSKIDNTGPINDKLAYRISVQGVKSDQYWANTEANFVDTYGALTWKPSSRVTVDFNLSYGRSTGAVPYGTNRLTQELIDHNIYSAGPASPIFKWNGTFYRAALTGSGFDTGTVSQGKFVKSGSVDAAPWTKASPADLQGWVTYAENTKKVKIEGNQTIYDKNAFGQDEELIAQSIASIELGEDTQLRNSTTYQFGHDYRYGYDLYQSYMVNKLGTDRIELIHKREFSVLGKQVKWQSNTGIDTRYLWNLCDNLGKPSEKSTTAPDAIVEGSLGTGYLLGSTDILRPYGQNDKNTSLYNSALTKYGYVQIAKTYQVAPNRWDGISIQSVGGSDIRQNQLLTGSLFTEHKFDFGEQVSLHVGGRLTQIRQWIKASPTTYEVRDSGYFPAGVNLSDKKSANNGDYNVSLTYRPAPWLSTYVTVDHDLAATDCGCCLSQGFTSPNNTLTWSYYRTLSTLREVGAKFDLIPNKLFATAAAFRQQRQVSSTISPSSPLYFPVQLLYNGAEFALNYQPNRSFAAGINYAYLNATLQNQTRSALASDYNGYVPDGVTLYSNSTGSNNPEASIRGNWRATGNPLNTVNSYVSYQFANGFGVNASAWFTSSWQANYLVTVPAQYNVNLGASGANKQWRVAVDITNATNQRNWNHGAGVGGDTTAFLLQSPPIGLQGRVAYKF